jgi:DNA-directed RNA polymerase specialized sigma24 family protein
MRARVEDGCHAPFPITRASVVLGFSSADAGERTRSFARVAQTYWKPIFKYVRLQWRKSASEAEEITQEFFARCLGKGTFGAYIEGRVRFRTFVRVCLDHFVLDLDRHDLAEKRGGKRLPVIDVGAAEVELVADPASLRREEIFEREWSQSVVDNAVDALRAACAAKGKDIHFRVFERIHLGAGPDKPSYATVADELGISIVDVTNRLTYARRELRAIILEALRELTTSDEELRAEVQVVLGIAL